MRDDVAYLRHIADSTLLVEQYRAGSDGSPDEARFYDDVRTQDAVLRRMETLVDAAARLSEVLKARHSHIPWRQISDSRNVLAHGYTDIRLDRMWQAIADDLPALKAVVDAELAGRQNDQR